jgi:hypothetical protein
MIRLWPSLLSNSSRACSRFFRPQILPKSRLMIQLVRAFHWPEVESETRSDFQLDDHVGASGAEVGKRPTITPFVLAAKNPE